MQILYNATNFQAKPGFRLDALEVYNWGTFHNKVWNLHTNRDNSLLTGDIGSGKSTIVDALTTLLVPHQKIIFNRAAGAEGKERTFYSYIRGGHKSEKKEDIPGTQTVYLRDESTYSVVLANFHNESLQMTVSLAIVFWIRQHKVEKFYICSENILHIKNDFSQFGTEIQALKKQLRKRQIQIIDSFREYSSQFRALFGLKDEQALELFYQTVSMKSVGNLTDFVRNHMLETTNITSRIDELKKSYENLSRSHQLVQKAKRQMEILQPIVNNIASYEVLQQQEEHLYQLEECLPVFFAQQRLQILAEKQKKLLIEKRELEETLDSKNQELTDLAQKENEYMLSRSTSQEGQQLILLQKEIQTLDKRKEKKRKAYEQYHTLIKEFGFGEVNASTFHQINSDIRDEFQSMGQTRKQLIRQRDELNIALDRLSAKGRKEEQELHSLERRKSKIPEKNLLIREKIIQALDLTEEELPFAGELLQVKEEEVEWQGAIEKLLFGFASSLLVLEKNYSQLNEFLNNTDLQGRIIYYRVPNMQDRSHTNRKNNTVAGKLAVKQDSVFYNWLESELLQRFHYKCCDTLDDFKQESYAITHRGLIKSGRSRHEKDDRRSVNDRRFFILGWSNEGKVQAIQTELQSLKQRMQELYSKRDLVEQTQKQEKEKEIVLHDLLKVSSYAEIDWEREAKRLNTLLLEKESLQQSSDVLHKTNEQLESVQQEKQRLESKRSQLYQKLGSLDKSLSDTTEGIEKLQNIADSWQEEEKTSYFPELTNMFDIQQLGENTIDAIERTCKQQLKNKLLLEVQAKNKKMHSIIAGMQKYKDAFPMETIEVDVSIASFTDFRSFLQELEEEDLPRHEESFKRNLNEGSIHDIAMFKNQLEIKEQGIFEKIEYINRSLRNIEYNYNTFIELQIDKSVEKSIIEFKEMLRNCLSNSEKEQGLYNEEKFEQVKLVLDKFNSGDPRDIDWVGKVTDVRNWFNFSVSEKWCDTQQEKEHYSDSSGKSGGQKEKLAYTILASALAYQFGLKQEESSTDRSFRFVVIDEAFGRGSDESTRYGLRLFEKLQLQLLVVTPLQKIHVIEDHVNSIHFIANPTGHESQIRRLSLQEYVSEKGKSSEGINIKN
ncbi:MAG: ATP-binding protein [Spirochaetota bacterium]